MNTAMVWIVWFLLCFGLVYLVVGAAITKRPRRWLYAKLGSGWGGWLSCAPCAAFWVGLAVGLPSAVPLAEIAPRTFAEPWALATATHLVGGLVIMAVVAQLQVHWGYAFAEIAREEDA
jgi:hypothetical protein